MRDKLTTLSELAGAAAIVCGVLLCAGIAAALVVGGLFLIGIGFLEGRN